MQGILKPALTTVFLVFLLFKGIVPHDDTKVIAASPESKIPAPVTSALCLSRPEIPQDEIHWLYVPTSPSELHTEVNYGYLAGRLIQNGYVDASSCPAGGIGLFGYANACGLAAAKPAVIQIQNMYDQAILDAFRESGTPPVMLKQLMRYESQFWPGQFGQHYGLGHLTYFGAYTALTWSPILAQIACVAAYGSQCNMQPVDDFMIGTFLSMMNPTCPTCQYGIDDAKAQQSILYLSHTLLAYCRQATQIVANSTGVAPSEVVDYPMIWKLALFNYNVGPSCMYDAIGRAYEENDKQPVDWETFTTFVYSNECQRGVDYVNNITEPFYDFSQ